MRRWLFPLVLVVLIGVAAIMLIPKEQYVVLISMDAFRWDYHEMYDTPELDNIAANGVRAESLVPAYPTKTFPNHYTLATGLYPDNHGLISNTFYAPDLERLYRIGDRSMVENGDFYFGEPIWTTVEKNGMIAASMFWVGSEAAVNGHQPTYWNIYDESVTYADRLDSVICWLSLPKKVRPRFITLYFDEPDGTSHDFGPLSAETDSVVTYLDGLIGELMDRIADIKVGKRVNTIIVSDHGMGEVSDSRVVNLKSYIPDELIEYYTGGNPSYLIDPVDEYQDSVLSILNSIPHVKAWSAETMPAHYHYGASERFPGLVAEADSSWSIVATDRTDYRFRSKGTHGYDPANSDMQGIFYASGPSIRSGITVPSIHNVDIYNLICRIFKIDPAENDGDQGRIEKVLK